MKYWPRLRSWVVWLLLVGVGVALRCDEVSAARAVTVNDGDTIRLDDGRRVRYLGIDTPEIDHEIPQRSQPFALQARERNQQLVHNRPLRIQLDQRTKDRYGRLLAYVFLPDGTFVNEVLLAEGLAVFLPDRENRLYDQRLLTAQRGAMQQHLGLWRHLASQPSSEVIGNRASHRFHAPDCPSAGDIARHNRFRLPGQWEAYWQGYAPARGCLGWKPSHQKE